MKSLGHTCTSIQNLVVISIGYALPTTADIRSRLYKLAILGPGTSSQGEGYSSKWLIWLVCGEPLQAYTWICMEEVNILICRGESHDKM